MALPLETLLDTVSARIISAADELTALDSAIGDADHGLNMKRGFEAVQADKAGIFAKPPGEALKAVGMTLVMKVGGASGPLYGTLFMTLGKELPENPSVADLGRALQASVTALKARGKADIGNKTMLDVLGPVAAHLESGSASIESVRALATESAKATIPMKAIRGRASFLGDRSIGHMDPGARSSEIMITAVCDVLEGKP
ncbi:dihydroxyacetone kinase subunit L [Aestuariivirga litoralis]|uniref:Dihydroxyacetone kinase subunit L n=1 Tax=Aestuariivirga litoralis TaxID=2650924 RepID=A0A2W2AQ23_9HYPH|nr:dihydroxyacetone kinase subunit DhaL [Aestuariivirga litoralis]PZF77505.1 dihydroxyacetone kinase subunit L [Aestuariivirga litoralis]